MYYYKIYTHTYTTNSVSGKLGEVIKIREK